MAYDSMNRLLQVSPRRRARAAASCVDTDLALKMVGKGSYDDAKFMRATTGCGLVYHAGDGSGELVVHELFQKELTPSDVGKLNRLVIPKKYAVRYFPTIQMSANKVDEGRGMMAKDGEGDGAEGMMLEFKDRQGRRWEFRYCYWRSSQSFVFTKGWNKFVKTKELSAKDTVVFYRCEGRGRVGRPFCMIDVELTSRDGDDAGYSTGGFGFRLGEGVAVEECGKVAKEEAAEEAWANPAVVMEEEREHQPRKRFKLFGVYIGR